MLRMLAASALLLGLTTTQPASAKACPTMKVLNESLERKLTGVPFQTVRKFFGGKPGHKWEALSLFAASEFSSENSDFLSESRYYQLKYASLAADEKKQMAADLVTKYLDVKSDKDLNVGAQTREKTLKAYAAETANKGVPSKDLFFAVNKDAEANLRDTFSRFVQSVQSKGLPQRDANGKITYDTSYKNCK